MIRKIVWVGFGLLLIGIVGSVFTFRSITETKETTEQKVEIDESFHAIEITSDEARVEVMPSDDSQARVELTGSDSNYRLSADVEDSILKVDVGYRQKKLFNFDFTAALLSLKVYVPRKEYESLQIESGNGRVHATDLQINNIKVETDNGHIKLKDLESTAITAEADNGAIDMKHITALTVNTQADNGKIILDDVTGELIGKTSNGSISLQTHGLDRAIDFATDNGRITIQTEKEPTNAVIDAKVDNGKVTVFGKSDWDTIVGKGENLIKLTADNGAITIGDSSPSR
jgi:DUF4097 and DUF4098 domain-containing protein YvlB